MRQTEVAGLYDEDFALWVKAQVTALREGRLSNIDVDNISEELEALAKRDRRELKSRLRVLGAHLLKNRYQPENSSSSWSATIIEQGKAIRDILDDSPSLKREFGSFVTTTYGTARQSASLETGLALDIFPSQADESFLMEVAEAIGDIAVMSRADGLGELFAFERRSTLAKSESFDPTND